MRSHGTSRHSPQESAQHHQSVVVGMGRLPSEAHSYKSLGEGGGEEGRGREGEEEGGGRRGEWRGKGGGGGKENIDKFIYFKLTHF